MNASVLAKWTPGEIQRPGRKRRPATRQRSHTVDWYTRYSHRCRKSRPPRVRALAASPGEDSTVGPSDPIGTRQQRKSPWTRFHAPPQVTCLANHSLPTSGHGHRITTFYDLREKIVHQNPGAIVSIGITKSYLIPGKGPYQESVVLSHSNVSSDSGESVGTVYTKTSVCLMGYVAAVSHAHS
jgi:hypothetical protein